MEIQKRVLGDRSVRWRVRWRQGGRYRARTFDRKGDALNFGAELRRRQQLGTIALWRSRATGLFSASSRTQSSGPARPLRSSGATSASRRSSSNVLSRSARRRTPRPLRIGPSGCSILSPPIFANGDSAAGGQPITLSSSHPRRAARGRWPPTRRCARTHTGSPGYRCGSGASAAADSFLASDQAQMLAYRETVDRHARGPAVS
jgi:hypothetical protein